MIITLCGSAKFEHGFHFWNKRLTLDGHVVFSLAVFPSYEGKKEWYDVVTKLTLDEVHKQKIDSSSAILVIDEWEGSEKYTGYSTAVEIEHATEGGKTVYYSSQTCPFPKCPSRLTQRPPCEICRG